MTGRNQYQPPIINYATNEKVGWNSEHRINSQTHGNYNHAQSGHEAANLVNEETESLNMLAKYFDVGCLVHVDFPNDALTFIADSGATSHITYCQNLLQNLASVSNRFVTIGNGINLPVKGIGEIHVVGEHGLPVILSEVLLVPNMKFDLFSLQKSHAQEYTILLNSNRPSKAEIIDAGGRVTFVANKFTKICQIRFQPTKGEHAHLTYDIWHQRLGHISTQAMKTIQQCHPDLHISMDCPNIDTSPCIGCTTGKMQRRPKTTSRSHPAKHKLEVTHSDVIGPYTDGYGEYKYYVTFIDEYTRYTRVYCMRNKSETLQKFQQYRQSVENIELTHPVNLTTRNKILRLQTDSGGEYMSNDFKTYLLDNGIQHYITSADEPRQN